MDFAIIGILSLMCVVLALFAGAYLATKPTTKLAQPLLYVILKNDGRSCIFLATTTDLGELELQILEGWKKICRSSFLTYDPAMFKYYSSNDGIALDKWIPEKNEKNREEKKAELIAKGYNSHRLCSFSPTPAVGNTWRVEIIPAASPFWACGEIYRT